MAAGTAPGCPRSCPLPRLCGIARHVHTPSAGGRSAWFTPVGWPPRACSGVAERVAFVLATSTEPSVRCSRRTPVVNRCQSGGRPGPRGVNIMCDSARTERWRLAADPRRGASTRESAGLHAIRAGHATNARCVSARPRPICRRPCDKRPMRDGFAAGGAVRAYSRGPGPQPGTRGAWSRLNCSPDGIDLLRCEDTWVGVGGRRGLAAPAANPPPRPPRQHAQPAPNPRPRRRPVGSPASPVRSRPWCVLKVGPVLWVRVPPG